jgi:hypothetical protein
VVDYLSDLDDRRTMRIYAWTVTGATLTGIALAYGISFALGLFETSWDTDFAALEAKMRACIILLTLLGSGIGVWLARRVARPRYARWTQESGALPEGNPLLEPLDHELRQVAFSLQFR